MELFKELDKELRHHPGQVVIYIAGGARMALGWQETRTTGDVDGVITKGHGAAVKAITVVGRRHGLTDSWMNEEMTGGLPRGSDTGETTLFHGSSLTVKGASARWMLAMKTAAGRAVDIADARTLIDHLKITNTKEIRELVTELYPNISGRKLTQIDTTLDKLARSADDLVNNHKNKARDNARNTTRKTISKPESAPDAWEKFKKERGLEDLPEAPPHAPPPAGDALREAEERQKNKNRNR